MQLRNHPMMVYRGRPNWPPPWTWIAGPDKVVFAVGEVGVLNNAQLSRTLNDTVFLTITLSDGNRYTGHLNFDDADVAMRICLILHENVGRTIEYIGGLEIV